MAGIETAPAPDAVQAPARTPRSPWRPSIGHVAMVLAGVVAALANFSVLRARDSAVTVLVAAWDIPAGQVVAAELFEAVDVRVDERLLGSFLRPADLAAHSGAVTLAPIPAGDPVLRSDLRSPAGPDGSRRMSIPVERARAAGGQLVPGDRVDVIAVRDGVASYIAAGVEVLDVTHEGGTALAGLDRFAVIVAVDARTALCLAEALQAGGVDVVRSTGAAAVTPGGCAPDAGGEGGAGGAGATAP